MHLNTITENAKNSESSSSSYSRANEDEDSKSRDGSIKAVSH